MYFNFNKKDSRFVNNLAETKPVLKHKFIIVGTDDKGKAYTTTIDNVMLVEARQEGKGWAKKHGLTLNSIRAL